MEATVIQQVIICGCYQICLEPTLIPTKTKITMLIVIRESLIIHIGISMKIPIKMICPEQWGT